MGAIYIVVGFFIFTIAAFLATNFVPVVVSTLAYWNRMLRLYAAPGAKAGGNV